MYMILQAQKVEQKKFLVWSQHNIMIWMAYDLIPEIIQENFKNL